MNVHDLPMVLFTVVTQMSVGAFIGLGIVEFVASRRGRSPLQIDRVVGPVLYAVGPTLVLGLLVSVLHLNDLTNTFNVMRHWQSSWLSREILFGVGFAAVGFLFAVLTWFQKGSLLLRQLIALVAALLGIGLVWAQSMVYYSLVTVPAWHTWTTPFFFFATMVLLGVLAVCAAVMVTARVRGRHTEFPSAGAPVADAVAGEDSDGTTLLDSPDVGGSSRGGLALQVRERVKGINAGTTRVEWSITARILTVGALVGAVAAVAILVVAALHVSELARGDAAAQASAEVFSGTLFWLRLVLLAVTAVLLAAYVHRLSRTTTRSNTGVLTTLVVGCLLLALTSELIGRALHYEAMFRVGI